MREATRTEGKLAHSMGKPIAACPYARGAKHDAWIDGWREAEMALLRMFKQEFETTSSQER